MEAILNLQTEFICQYNQDLRLTYVNRAYREWLGLPENQLIGTDFMSRIPPEERAQAMSHIQSLTAEHPTAVSIHQSIMPDGALVTIEWTDRALFDDAGRLTGYLGVGRDITERERQAHQILTLKNQLSTILDTIKDAILYLTLPDNTIAYASASLEKIFGYPAERFINEPTLHRNLIHPADLDRFLHARETAFREGYTALDHRIVWPDGQVRWVHRRVWVNFDPDGQPANLIDAAHDITEREKAKTALEEANNRLENLVQDRTAELAKADDRLAAIFNHSGDSLILFNIYQGIQQANHAFESLLKVKPADYLGKHLDQYLLLEGTASFEELIREIVTTHRKLEIEARTSTGISVELSLAPVNRSENAVTNLVCIVRDITDRKQHEAALKRYTAEIEDLYNHAPTGYHSLNRDGLIVRINDTELKWLGYSREEVVGKLNIIDIFSPSSQAIFRKNYPIALKQGFINDLELEMIRQDGSLLPVLVSATHLRDEAGNMLYSRSSVFDNTELMKARQALAEERNLLRTVIDTVPDYIYVKDNHHQIVLNNLSHARTLGLNDPVKTVGKTDNEFFPPEMVAKFQADEEQLFQTGQPVINTEERSLGQDGRETWAITTKVPLKNLTGEVTGLVGITRDITDRKRTEARILEAEELFRTLFESLPDMVLVTDTTGHYVNVNSTALKLLGYNREEFLQLTSEDLVTISPEQILSLRKTYLEKGYWQDEVELRTKDGRLVPCDARNKLITLPGAKERLGVIVIRDITERKQAEETLKHALEKEKETGELKSRFVSIASHEFRTPLASILATAETLTFYRDRMNHEQIDARLNKIRQQVMHMREIMDDVLQLAKMQAGRIEYKPVSGDLHALCLEIIEEFESQLPNQGRINYSCSSPLVMLDYDPFLMRGVINNLVSNALKYSPQTESIQLELSQAEDQVTFKVKDRGIGIPPEDLKHLFEPFHRATNVGTISGTGLGLTIASQSVEMHGGTINAESEPGQGTTFTVTLPALPALTN